MKEQTCYMKSCVKGCQVLAYLAKLKCEYPKSQSHILGAGCENLGMRNKVSLN